MTLQEHYKFHSRKSIKPYFCLLLLIIFGITAFFTLARYISSAVTEWSSTIAKWHIVINEQEITNDVTTISNVRLINTVGGTSNFKAGDTCYFDITINPTETEVSFSYTIAIDLTAGENHLPDETQITEYKMFVGESDTATSTTIVNASSTEITEDLKLTQKQALDSQSIHRYRVYCTIPEEATIEAGKTFEVKPIITLEQIIGEN